jgi:hypothetical protein
VLQVKVLYDFEAESEQELPLKAGQYVTIVEEVDENWYRGKTADGKVRAVCQCRTRPCSAQTAVLVRC